MNQRIHSHICLNLGNPAILDMVVHNYVEIISFQVHTDVFSAIRCFAITCTFDLIA